MKPIVTAPNEVLSKIAKKFDFENDKNLNHILKDMEESLLSASDPKGVGLAAPQIGISYSIFIAKPTEESEITEYINPEIIEHSDQNKSKPKSKTSKKKLKKLEGCLSLPNIWGEVLRASSVTITYQTKTGAKKKKKFTGFMATIIQHEIDHLNGVLFPKRVLEQKGTLYQSSKNEKGQDEFEELNI